MFQRSRHIVLGTLLATALLGCESLPEWRIVVTERDDFDGVVQDTYEVLQQSFVRRAVRVDREPENAIARLQTDVVITAMSDDFDFARAQAFAYIHPRLPRGFRVEVLVLIEELQVGELTATPIGDDENPGESSIEEVTGGKWVPAGRDEEFENFLLSMLRHKLRQPGRSSTDIEVVPVPRAPLDGADPEVTRESQVDSSQVDRPPDR